MPCKGVCTCCRNIINYTNYRLIQQKATPIKFPKREQEDKLVVRGRWKRRKEVKYIMIYTIYIHDLRSSNMRKEIKICEKKAPSMVGEYFFFFCILSIKRSPKSGFLSTLPSENE